MSTEAKKIQIDPYVGLSLKAKATMNVNFRKGVKNMLECQEVKCTAANATGRRLTCTFYDTAGVPVMERRIYREYFEKIAEKFEVELPE